MKILLVGINYEPELAGIGPYTSGLAKHFAEEGHEVTVITGVPHYPQWKRLKFGLRRPLANLTVRRYNHFVPRFPRTFGRSLYEITWLLSALRAVPVTKGDVVIGIVPSLSGAVLAWLIASRLHRPFGLLFQDLMGSAALQSGYTGSWRVARVASRVELALARRAAAVAIVAEGFRAYLEAGGVSHNKIWRVRNWAATSTVSFSSAEMRRRLGWGPNEFVCLHAGNMGQKQGLDNVLEAGKLLQGKEITVVLAGDGNDRPRLVARARNLRLSNVRFVGVQPPGLYESMLQAADVLLLNQRASVSDMALPSKLASYFAAGRPVLAAVAAGSEAAREVEAAGGKVVGPDAPPDLADALVRLKAGFCERDKMAKSVRAYFEVYLDRDMALQSFDRLLVNFAPTVLRDSQPTRSTSGEGLPF